jgi:hypothetical protein
MLPLRKRIYFIVAVLRICCRHQTFKILSQHILELITQEYLHLQDLLQESSQQLNNHQKLSPRHKVKQKQWQTNSLQSKISKRLSWCSKHMSKPCKTRLQPSKQLQLLLLLQ